MDFIYRNNTLTIESEKKEIMLNTGSVVLDGLTIEMPGEYEKWGFLAYAHSEQDALLVEMRIEGYRVGYITHALIDLSVESLDFLGDLDVLVMPTLKGSIPLLEKIEPRMLVTYGETAHETATSLGVSEPPVGKYRLKEADLSGERMGCVVMGE